MFSSIASFASKNLEFYIEIVCSDWTTIHHVMMYRYIASNAIATEVRGV